MVTGGFCVLQALLLHGSLPEDEQEVSLCLGDGVENAEQQLVRISCFYPEMASFLSYPVNFSLPLDNM